MAKQRTAIEEEEPGSQEKGPNEREGPSRVRAKTEGKTESQHKRAVQQDNSHIDVNDGRNQVNPISAGYGDQTNYREKTGMPP
jgi:hypothetical protein